MDERCENDETRALAYAPSVLLKVILYGYARGMIGREMFAIDGVKLPSNASKTKTGTRAEFERQAGKIETEVKKMLSRHRKADAQVVAPELAQKEAPRVWSG